MPLPRHAIALNLREMSRIQSPLIVIVIGLISAIVDNVPLVAASMGMYSLEQHPQDSFLWEFLAYCAGTGGSILIIGSAAGVAAMGLEKIDFFWYVKKISDGFRLRICAIDCWLVGRNGRDNLTHPPHPRSTLWRRSWLELDRFALDRAIQ